MPGAHEYRPGVVRWALYAPGKQSVSIIGDWNKWNCHANPMHATPEGLWWLETPLGPGRQLYKFCIDGQIEIGDPYARELGEGAEVGQPAAAITVGAEPYRWGDTGWQAPPFNDLVIYELHIGDFNAPYTFDGAGEKLSYVRDLGINAIELMPVFEFSADNHGWGYNPAYFFCPDTHYGQPNDLRRFIDQAHQHGIAVILDVVFAHTGHEHPFNRLYPYKNSPWYGSTIGQQNQFGFPALDHTKRATQAFVRDVQRFWIEEYHVDGFRYDYTLGIGYDGENGVTRMARDARAVKADVYLIAEQSPERPEVVRETEVNAAWHLGFHYMLKALMRQGQFLDWNWEQFDRLHNVLSPTEQGYADQAQMVNFIESHDETRAVFEVNTVEGMNEEVGRYKSALAAMCLFTAPGVPMLYHGQEWGEATGRTMDHNPLHWDALDTNGGRGLHDVYRKLIHLRREHVSLRLDGYAISACDQEHKTVVYHRWDPSGDEVVVVLNFSPDEHAVVVEFPSAAHWVDVLSDFAIDADGEVDIPLGSSSGRIFIKT
ncbi:MAG: alpha-amylase family glycosyl hydrolase [Herpetosiphon sp.]